MTRAERPQVVTQRRILFSLLVITLTSVIVGRAGSVPESSQQQQANSPAAEVQAKPEQPKVGASVEGKSSENVAPKVDLAKAAESPVESIEKRKGRAEPEASSKAAGPAPAPEVKPLEAKASEKADEKPAAAAAKEQLKSPEKPRPAKNSILVGKSAPKSKLPANLGTVTSTGSGGPAHYMSKHDAYSAIAEKHGALAHEAVRKSDKRQLHTGFGGIQKASGFGDVLSPFKGVTDSGLARTLGASMRSIMKSKFSVPAYAASAILGAIALMAFYESPISPLPVPALPEPPVGRFPPEMPNISPNLQVPFRTNQGQYGQNYNQRSFGQFQPNLASSQQQPQQVLFPGSQNAQQRQMNVGSQSSSSSPVQQLAANLLGKQQNAQRKSGVDQEQSSPRSLFGGSSQPSNSISQKVGAPANQQKSSSFLSYFGLGGSSGSSAESSPAPSSLLAAANGLSQTNGMSPLASAIEAKGQANGNNLSGSHLVNKVKSMFNRAPVNAAAPGQAASSPSASSSANPYDQYQRMSLVQALMKDAAFLPGYLSPTRKSSSAAQSSSSGSNRIQSIANALSAASPLQSTPAAAARMQVGDLATSPFMSHPQQALIQSAAPKQKPASSSFGLYKAADRVAHALLETFTSGIMQRQSQSASSGNQRQLDGGARKSSSADESPLASATSLLSDIMSTYQAVQSADQKQAQPQQSAQPQQHEQKVQQAPVGGAQQQVTQPASEQQQARSLEVPASESAQTDPKVNQQSKPSESSASSQPNGIVRKTRSIGLEYPIENNQMLALREQSPSKAAQINNVIDFVADSYSNNRLLFNFVMNQVGLSQAVPYVEQILATGNNEYH